MKAFAQARGNERLAMAEPSARYKPGSAPRRDARTAALESAKAREHAETIAGHRSQATAAGNDADYAAAVEKCGAIPGDARSLCVSDAKAHYGKP